MPTSYLVDTHTFIWWSLDRPGVSQLARSILKDSRNDVVLSVVTPWEMLIKYGLGKLALPVHLVEDVGAAAVVNGFRLLPVSFLHAQRISSLPQFKHHRDPFDRMLIAQALCEGLTLLSNEDVFDEYGVGRIW